MGAGHRRGLGDGDQSRQIGALGLNLVLVDIRGTELAQVAEEVRKTSGVEVKAVVTDLSRVDTARACSSRARRRGANVIPAEMRRVGADLDLVTVYRTVPSPAGREKLHSLLPPEHSTR